jgi:hypothetical protein
VKKLNKMMDFLFWIQESLRKNESEGKVVVDGRALFGDRLGK